MIEFVIYNMLSVLGMTYMSEKKDRIVLAPMLFLEFVVLGGSYFIALAWLVAHSGYDGYKDMTTAQAMMSFGRWELVFGAILWTIILWCNKDDNFLSDGTTYFREVFIPYNELHTLRKNYNIYRREEKKKELEDLSKELQYSIDKIINK